MATTLDGLDPDSPEFEAAIEAAQAEEDEAIGNVEQPVDATGPDPKDSHAPAASEAPDAVAAATEEAPTTEAEAQPAPKVAGIANKDGTKVLPYAALQAERRRAQHESRERQRAEQERDELRQQIADLRAGKTSDEPNPSDDTLTDEEIAAVAADFPQVAKLANRLKTVEAKLSKQSPAVEDEPAQPENDPVEAARSAVQDEIDSIPLLLDWQAQDPEKFARAVELDKVFKVSPKWVGKSLGERLEHVTKLVADEYDIPFEPTPRTPTPTPPRVDPKKAVQAAARTAPNTLSDLKGGAIDQTPDRIDKLPPLRAMAAMGRWSDEQIEAHLARTGG